MGAVVASFIVLTVLAVIGRFLGVFSEETVKKFVDTALKAIRLGIKKDKNDQEQETARANMSSTVDHVEKAEIHYGETRDPETEEKKYEIKKPEREKEDVLRPGVFLPAGSVKVSDNISKIVFLATNWGAKYGGINSFNTDICGAFAKLLHAKYKIICIVFNATEEEKKDASRKGVTLIPINPGSEKLDDDWVDLVLTKIDSIKPEGVHAWIGHDVKTGFGAIKAARKSSNSISAVVHHMNYRAYTSIWGGITQNLILEQRQLLTSADLIFAVGPKLSQSARDKISKKDSVIELIPGLAEIRELEIPEVFTAITFGRFEDDTDRLKLASLAVAAFSKTIRDYHNIFPPDSSITVIGLSEQEDNQKKEIGRLRRLADVYAGRTVQLHTWPFLEDRDKLFNELVHHSVCFMLSIHEGFGLVGWEAIAAGVPLVLSRNSGVYEFIDHYLEGPGTGCVYPVDIKGSMINEDGFIEEDINGIVEALIQISQNPKKAKRNALCLKKSISGLFTWESAARKMISHLGISVNDQEYITKTELAGMLECPTSQIDKMLEKIREYYKG